MLKKVLLLVGVMAFVSTACGGAAGADDGVASLQGSVAIESLPADGPALSDEEALFAFAACMRENGVEIEDPTVDAEGNLRLSRPQGTGDGDGPNEEARAAREICGEVLEGVTLGFGDQDRTELEDQLLEFAACMRDNGYDMPDPDLTAAGPGQGGPFGELDRNDPDFQAASESCQDVLSGFGPGGGGRGAGPNG